jgi:hypothetical protein
MKGTTMTKLDITKTVVKIVVGSGTAKIVQGIVRNNTSPASVTDTVAISGGCIVLGMMVGDIAGKYTDAKIDEIADWWKTNVKKS